ncbi:MAG: SDR family NAD(P)-dependent oxidoreductase, partial [Gemmatimonadetes bacterium]|nr:SDR family NAD(P)-dependent oxidoreductase [Gemmatimonadota bacterium]
MQGREIVVTGGGGALGEAVVRRLAREGARLVLPVRSEARAASMDEALGGLGTVVAGIDATDEQAVDALFAEYGKERPLWASIH